jgi:hypothetical protein
MPFPALLLTRPAGFQLFARLQEGWGTRGGAGKKGLAAWDLRKKSSGRFLNGGLGEMVPSTSETAQEGYRPLGSERRLLQSGHRNDFHVAARTACARSSLI